MIWKAGNVLPALAAFAMIGLLAFIVFDLHKSSKEEPSHTTPEEPNYYDATLGEKLGKILDILPIHEEKINQIMYSIKEIKENSGATSHEGKKEEDCLVLVRSNRNKDDVYIDGKSIKSTPVEIPVIGNKSVNIKITSGKKTKSVQYKCEDKNIIWFVF